MAGASDKARYYLEQAVPELQEYARKGIFTSKEITAIAAKRSDFEHTLNGRGSKSADYARYATYEMNLDALRKKRCKRLGVKKKDSGTAHSGQRTVFFILDRATKKFPGDMELWMQYIQFCQQQKANKKLAEVFTSVLRLKPQEWGLWVLAAKHYAENDGDMTQARSYMQRGLRFCKRELKLWLEYVRLEMGYLARLGARKRSLAARGKDFTAIESKKSNADEDAMLLDEDVMSFPALSGEDIQPRTSLGFEPVDNAALEKLASTPVFTGAIPMSIFDAAMKQFQKDEAADNFFDLVASFDQVQASRKILQHIFDYMKKYQPSSVEEFHCEAKLVLFGIEMHTVEFPAVLGKTLALTKRNFKLLNEDFKLKLAEKTVFMLLPYLTKRQELDEDVVTVLESSVRKYLTFIAHVGTHYFKEVSRKSVARMVKKLQESGRQADALTLLEIAEPTKRISYIGGDEDTVFPP